MSNVATLLKAFPGPGDPSAFAYGLQAADYAINVLDQRTAGFNTSGAQTVTSRTLALTPLAGSTDAVPPHTSANYIVTASGVDGMTLAAPTVTTDDGLIIVITSTTAHAHTLTATGLLNTGSAKTDVATFAAFAGAGLTLMAYQGTWNVLASVGITFT